GDRGDGDVVDVDALAADEVQEQVERALEHRELDARRVGRQRGLDALGHGHGRRSRRLLAGLVGQTRSGAGIGYWIFIAARTSSIVARAVSRARREPSARMSHTVSGRAAYSGRRAWIFSRRCS